MTRVHGFPTKYVGNASHKLGMHTFIGMDERNYDRANLAIDETGYSTDVVGMTT
jgi:hypothetical protein